MKELHIHDFHEPKAHGDDFTPAVTAALARCRELKNCRLIFPTGTYRFRPDFAREEFLCFSNNDYGRKRMAFPLLDVHGLTIDGRGSTFLCEGHFSPVVIAQSSAIRLQDFTLDHTTPFFGQARIVDRSVEALVLDFSDSELPCDVVAGCLVFRGENFTSSPAWHYHATFLNSTSGLTMPNGGEFQFFFEPARHLVERTPKWRFMDAYTRARNNPTRTVTAERLSDGLIRLRGSLPPGGAGGDTCVIRLLRRWHSGVAITDSRDVTLDGVTIRQASAMGVLAQTSRDLLLRNVTVARAAGSQRLLSVNNDATHFVNCRGKLRLEKCRLQHNQDDSINVHGNHLVVRKPLDAHRAVLGFGYFQQRGINILSPGDTVLFRNAGTLAEIATATVRSSHLSNLETLAVEFAEPAAAKLNGGETVDNVSASPDLTITGCDMGENRGRGLLINTARRAEVVDNHLSHHWLCVRLAGDARWWFESSAVGEVLIARNRVTRAGTFVQVDPDVDGGDTAPAYHGKVILKNNRFDQLPRKLITAHHLRELVLGSQIGPQNESLTAETLGPDRFSLANVGKLTSQA